MNLHLVAAVLAFYFASSEAAEFTAQQKQKLKEYYQACSASSGASQEALGKISKGEFTNDPKVNKFFGCMFRKTGLQNDKGEFQLNIMKSKMPAGIKSEDVDKVVQACTGTKGADADETAFLLYRCYYEKSPQHVAFW